MGRGGGGGGSHRSSGGGGSRSFGGSSRSSSSHRGGYSGGSRPSMSTGRPGGGFRPPPPPGPRYGGVRVNNYYGGGYRSGPAYRGPARRISVSAILITMICVIVFFMVLGFVAGGSGGNISKSTVQREALTPYAAFQRNCWDDRADWLADSATLNRGMEAFYKATGVQPALAIVEDIDGSKSPSNSDVESWATREYDELVGHERGVLLLFCEWYPSDYTVYYMAGEDAQTVMDSEACGILVDYVHDYYTSSMTEDEYFGTVFEKTGERIMSVTPTMASRTPMILGTVVVAAVLIAVVKMLGMKYRREKERAEETERILNTPNERL